MPPNTKSQSRFEVVIPKRARESLREYAEKHSLSEASLIRAALQEYFDKRGEAIDFTEGLKAWTRNKPEDNPTDT